MTRVAVVGAGVMGCAAAWALTELGADVTVLEQFELEHTRGSSHGRTRIVRTAYPEAAWVRLAREAMDGWRELEAQSGQTLLGLHGLVEVCSAPELTSAAALDACGEPYRFLDEGEARALGVVVPEGWTALEQPDAGVVRADLARRAFLDVAVARGAGVETGVRVESRRRRGRRRRRAHRGSVGDAVLPGRAGARDARDDRVLRARRCAGTVGRRAGRGDAAVTRCTRCTTRCTG